AVELHYPPADIGQLGTLVGVLSRAIDVMITQNEHHSLALAKAKVRVDMKGFAITDYNRVDELVQLGYEAAASQSAELLPYAITDSAEWQRYLDERNARKRVPITNVEKVVVAGPAPDTAHRTNPEATISVYRAQ